MEIVKYVMENWQEMLNAGTALITGVVAVSLIIPGEQPEKFLQSVLNFIKKFSKK